MAYDSKWYRVERMFGDGIVIDERQQKAIDVIHRHGMELAQAILQTVDDFVLQDRAISGVHEAVLTACSAIARFPSQDEVQN